MSGARNKKPVPDKLATSKPKATKYRSRIKDYRGLYTTCTPELIERICDLRSKKYTIKALCMSIGMKPATLGKWADMAKDGKPYDLFLKKWSEADAEFYKHLWDDAMERNDKFSTMVFQSEFLPQRTETAVQVNVDSRIGGVDSDEVKRELIRRAMGDNKSEGADD